MIDRSLFRLPGIRQTLAIVAICALVRGLLVIGQSWSLTSALCALWEGDALEAVMPELLAFAAFFVCRQLVLNVQESHLDGYSSARAAELRCGLLSRLMEQGRKLSSTRGTGSLVDLVVEGVDRAAIYIAMMVPRTISLVMVPLVILVVLFAHDWISGVISLVAFPAIMLNMKLIGLTARTEADSRHDEHRRLSNHFIDSLRGLDTLRFFGRSKSHAASIYDSSERFRETTMRTMRTATLSGAVLDLFSTLALAAVAIMLGFRLVDGSLALFPALLCLMLVPEYFRPIRDFAADYHASLEGRNALASLLEAIDERAGAVGARATSGSSVGASGTTSTGAASTGAASTGAASTNAGADMSDTASPAPLGWNDTSKLTLADISFSYPTTNGTTSPREALSEITATITGFEKIGIVGASGSGKSTLVSLLGGFETPTSGSITATGPNGGCETASQAWRSMVSYIPQDPYIFHATLRDNLRFYRPDADDDAVMEAVRAVGLTGLVKELPEGLDEMIGEGARALSGGQAQRIALARVLVDRSRRVLIFDEPTAHLDIETEMELKERMLPLMEERLVLFATHRLHWLADMDEVMVLDAGRLVAFGTPSDLTATPDSPLLRLAVPDLGRGEGHG